MKNRITPARLKELFDYDPATGHIVRKSNDFRTFTTKGPRGFCCGLAEGRQYLAHRVAWALHHGVWPTGDIKCINGDRTDIRLENLEEVEAYTQRIRKPQRKDPLPTYEEMSAEYQYNPDTGRIYNIWKECFVSVQSGGYRYGWHKDRNILAHRVAWLLYYGEWPKHEIDHIDHDRMNNKIKNLRSVTGAENAINKTKGMNNSSGVVGVSWVEDSRVWKAYIGYENKLIVLGSFKKFNDAVKSRKAAEFKYGYHENHGKVANRMG